MRPDTLRLYRRALAAGYSAAESMSTARTVEQFREFLDDDDRPEDVGAVRIVAEDDPDSPFDVYGEPEGYVNAHGRRVSAEDEWKELVDTYDRLGVWIVASQVWTGEAWRTVDSVGQCSGYSDPCDPVENCYVPQMMRAALDARTDVLRDSAVGAELASLDE